MNLSDLVHRTAGDNKVLTSNFETSANTMITPSSSTTQPPPPPTPPSFEHNNNTTEFTTVDPSSFQRQQHEAYLFPMQATANWTPQAFLQHQHQQQQLEEQRKQQQRQQQQQQQQHKDAASRIPLEQKKVVLDAHLPYQQNAFTFTTNTTTTTTTTSAPSTNSISKATTQKIAPAPPPPLSHSFTTNNNNIIMSNNNININNNTNTNNTTNMNNSSNNINTINTPQEIKVFHHHQQQSIAPFPRNMFQLYEQQPIPSSLNSSSPSLSLSLPSSAAAGTAGTVAAVTKTTATTQYNMTASTLASTSSSSTTATANGLVPIAPLQIAEEPKKPAVIITGDNVDANNLEEGYIQFVLRHDANYIGDGIESLMYAKRKFSSVPKTGDLSYTTWDIFQLVQKLYTQEIRNWSQLVGQLGLADMAGRPQFAQRVKRWMHKYKIDCYFDYLLGNDYNFNSPDEKYSGCLMMGNYQKRKSENGKRTDETDSVKSSEDEHRRPLNRKRFSDDEMENEEADDSDDNTSRIPILLAGSRKRMRDTSQNSLQMIENARQFMRTTTANHSEDEDDQEELMMGENGLEEDNEDDDDNDDENRVMMVDNNHDDNSEMDGENEEEEKPIQNSATTHRDSPVVVDHSEMDEEDELASTCSSPGSALLDLNSNIPLDDTPFPLSPSSHRSNTDEPDTTICPNCHGDAMKSEVAQLKSFIKSLESKLEHQIKLNQSNVKQIEKLLEEKQQLRTSTEKWKRKLIEDLVRGPKLTSDDDDVMP